MATYIARRDFTAANQTVRTGDVVPAEVLAALEVDWFVANGIIAPAGIDAARGIAPSPSGIDAARPVVAPTDGVPDPATLPHTD